MFESILAPAPYDLRVEDGDDDSKEVLVAISQCLVQNRVASIVSNIAPFVLDDREAWEFSFMVVVVSLDETYEPLETMDRAIASEFIPDDIRHQIMDVVCASLQALILATKPQVIHMVTKERNLPPNAMAKYDRLISLLDENGLSVAQSGTNRGGQEFWTMQSI